MNDDLLITSGVETVDGVSVNDEMLQLMALVVISTAFEASSADANLFASLSASHTCTNAINGRSAAVQQKCINVFVCGPGEAKGKGEWEG